ncbi:MAG: hypothetical protein ACFFD4_34850 [Candidatus Odinarchaeota archaeon]
MSQNEPSRDQKAMIILYYLSKSTELENISEISESVIQSYQTASKKMGTLAEFGLIEMSSDGTAKIAVITDKGREYLKIYQETSTGKKSIPKFDKLLKKGGNT